MSDSELLDPRVAQAFYGRFDALRPAQEAAIRPLLAGSNVILCSATGSGKTEAILAPLLSLHWRSAAESDSLVVLYIAPTRALLNDLLRRIEGPIASLGLRVGIRHGDRNDLNVNTPLHVLLTTPESLDVLLFGRAPCLKTVKALVLDEVHLLYNTQRGLHLSILVRRLRQQAAGQIQWAALSATISRPEDIRSFLFGEKEPVECLQFPGVRVIDAHVKRIADDAQFLDVMRRLHGGRPTKLVVFADSRKVCERLAGVLHRDPLLAPIVSTHYSSLAPAVRLATEARFEASRQAICIATSTLELGVDIGDIDAAVLWGVPFGVESFLQRIGRSNRRSHRTNVVCLVPDDSAAPLADTLRFIAVLRMAEAREMPTLAPYELYGAIAQQCLNVIAADQGAFKRIADLAALAEHLGYADRASIETILGELEAKDYLRRHGFKNQYGANEQLHRLVDYFMIYGNFGIGSQTLEVRHGSKSLGTVPAVNLLCLHPGLNVRLAGKTWHVLKCSPDGFVVAPAQGSDHAEDFVYPGRGRTCDPAIVDKVRQVLFSDGGWSDVLARADHDLLTAFRSAFQLACSPESIPFIQGPEAYHYLTFGGGAREQGYWALHPADVL